MPINIIEPSAELWYTHPNNIPYPQIVASAARVCYRSPGDDDAGLCEKLLGLGHMTPFEHKRYVYDFDFSYYDTVYPGMGITYNDDNDTLAISFNHRHLIEHDNIRKLFDCQFKLSYDDMTQRERFHHAAATFEIRCSRACSHQIVRHRMASYSQESQRYVDMSEPEIIVPQSIKDKPLAMRAFGVAMAAMIKAYQTLVKLGVPKEDARFVLPNAAATRIIVTMTFEYWAHFLDLRLDKHAQWEIRDIAGQIARELARVDPENFGRYTA